MTSEPQHPALTELISILDLAEIGSGHVEIAPVTTAEGIPIPETFAEDISMFLGKSQKMPHGRVYGGQVLAQGIIASGRTVAAVEGEERRRLHSIHAYFMRPGDDTEPITFSVERMRDGRSFSTRRVHAIQHGKPILSMSASFQVPDTGVDHQDPMPAVGEPMSYPSLAQAFAGIDHPGAKHLAEGRAIEQRHVQGHLYFAPGSEHVAQQSVWIRAVGELPDDPLIHEAVLAYSSDYSLLESVLRRHGKTWREPGMSVASLDHAMWFHRPARADQWILYAQESPSAQGGRGLGIGRMFAADGTLVATVAQEGMVRFRDS